MSLARCALAFAAFVVVLPPDASARHFAPARVPMSTAKAMCVERACRRVYGDAPETVRFCTQTYLSRFLASVMRTPFCPSNAALLTRLQPCADALAAKLFAEAVPGTLSYAPESYSLEACSEAQLCGAPFL